jgi:4-hydroxy-3-polyprenylbenzoate decarboxylase
MDTLDYSGIGLNQGSKLVIAAAGRKRRKLGVRLPDIGEVLPGDSPHMNLVNVESQGQSAGVLPGVLILQCPVFENPETEVKRFQDLSGRLGPSGLESSFPLIVLADDAHFTGNSLNNFLWVTFSRANPSHDVHGVDSFFQNKHWGCRGSLIIDARIKPHHAPPLIEDSQVTRKVDALATAGGPLHGII